MTLIFFVTKKVQRLLFGNSMLVDRGLHKELTLYVSNHKTSRLEHFRGIHIFPDRLIKLPSAINVLLVGLSGGIEDPDIGCLQGATATVIESGEISARGTLTRSIAFAGWQKKVDTRTARLQISGPSFYWSIPIAPQDVNAAYKFAARIMELS